MPAHLNPNQALSARVAIAYILRGAAGSAIDDLRRRYDPRTAAALPAHLTLAGPVHVSTPFPELFAALEAVTREAAAFELAIAGAGTFLPVSATAFLEVSLERDVRALHDRLIAYLGWVEAYPYHPHVTVAEYLTPEETTRVHSELQVEPSRWSDHLDRITLLAKELDGRWTMRAELPLRV